MKTLMYLSICLLLPSLLWATPIEVKVKGTAGFTSEAPLEKIEGTATSSGKLQVDLEDFTAIRGEIKVPVASMETGNSTRDDHLRGTDWLDATKCPDVSFKVESVEVAKAVKENKKGWKVVKLKATGDFQVHCKSKKMTIPVKLKWKEKEKNGKKFTKVVSKSSFKITLADYDVAGAKGVVGEKVGKTIDVKVKVKGKIPK